ncbi:MAG: DUF6320 domain-containing protein [Clostridiales bacterium]|jgi:hypothetical protein|nr:DUF6320 domain-containing protein [Clostridiales bacterium]
MRCYNCGADVRGDIRICPLCHNKLKDEGLSDGVYPVRAKNAARSPSFSFDKVFWFVFLNAVTVCAAINIWLKTEPWSAVVAAGLIYVYVFVKSTMNSKSDIAKRLFFQILFLSVVFAAINFAFFDRKMEWVFEYALPVLYAASALLYGILILIRVRNFHDYILYELFVIVLGIIPAVLYFTGIIKQGIPAFVCFFTCIMVFLSNLIFSWKFVKNELKKRFHA